MVDLSGYSDEDLLSIVGSSGQSSPLASMSDDDLLSIVNGSSQSAPTTITIRGAGNTTPPPEDILSSPQSQPLGFSENIAGGFTNILDSLTVGGGDELVAGGSALLDYLKNGGENSLSDSYGERLGQVRGIQKQYANDNPFANIFQSVGSSFLNPLFAAGKVKGIKDAVVQGGKFGGLFGFGEGEGGLQNRAINAAKQAGVGAVTGGTLQTVGKGLSVLGKEVLPRAEKLALRSSIGAKGGDFNSSGRNRGLTEIEDGIVGSSLAKSVQEIEKEGLWKGSKAPQELLQRVTDAKQLVSDKTNILLGNASQALQGVKLKPRLSLTERFINSKDADTQQLLKTKVQEIVDAQNAVNGGKGLRTILDWQKEKTGLYDRVYNDDKAKDTVAKYIASDIKNMIEKATAVAMPDKVGVLKDLNRRYGNYQTVTNKFLKRGVTEAESGNIANQIKAVMRTSGGVGTGIIATAASGNPLLGVALGSAIQGLSTRSGNSALNSLFKNVAPLASKSGSAIEAIAPTIARSAVAQSNSFPEGIEVQDTEIVEEPTQRDPIQEAVKSLTTKKGDTMPKNDDTYNAIKEAQKIAESSGNPNAISPKGATGLYQIMPATGKDIAKSLGIKDYNLKDPATSELFRDTYMDLLLERYDDDYPLALAAYNAGMGKVDNWIERYGRDWNQISKNLKASNQFSETTNYVSKILKKSNSMMA